MNRRLEQLYQMISKQGRGVVDVGTDHCLIPIQLAQSGYPGKIIATDIAEGPLHAAKEAAEASGLADRIQFLLCDGLDLCPQDQIDCILIAGMGGDTICGILDRAEWIFNGDYRIVLQPMTRAEVLRYWLVHNEFRIDTEAVSQDEQHVYQMFSARLGQSEHYSDAEYLIGSLSATRIGEPLSVLIERELRSIEKKLNGLVLSGNTDTPTYFFYNSIRQQLLEMNGSIGA